MFNSQQLSVRLPCISSLSELMVLVALGKVEDP